jgi:hypothetical protein
MRKQETISPYQSYHSKSPASSSGLCMHIAWPFLQQHQPLHGTETAAAARGAHRACARARAGETRGRKQPTTTSPPRSPITTTITLFTASCLELS